MRTRLIFSFFLVVFVAILEVVVFVRLEAQRQVQTFMFGGGMVGADQLVLALQAYHRQNGSWRAVENILRHPLGMERMHNLGEGMMGMSRLILLDERGRLIYDTSEQTLSGTQFDQELLSRSIALKDQRGRTIGYLLVGGSAMSALIRGAEKPLLRNLNNAALRAGLLAMALALGAALWLSGRLIHPIQQLTQAAQKVSAGDLSQKVPVSGNDELAALATSFNTMIESLRQSEIRRQAMTADIAHELRTPLAVQRAHLEALQDGIYPLTPQNLQPVLHQTEILSRLVEDLRTLALADAGELQLQMTTISVTELLEGVLNQFRSSAEAHQVRLEFLDQSNSNPQVTGDPDRLVQIMNNLLSNALRYTPKNGLISVAVCSDNRLSKWVEIQVLDNGPGIPAEALPFIFERFYRADRARSRNEGGTGLGLAIARQLALAHGGDLFASNRPEGGAKLTLRLPRAGFTP